MSKIITGTCICPGKAEGKLTLFKEGKSYTKDDIVVMDDWLTQKVLKSKDAGALLSKTGSITCHASIIARELDVPTLINVDIAGLEEGKEAIVNTEEEKVEIK
ncbi:MAG: PEP-utilizing enzyme [Candidatus Woesearchaeota archaeon]